MGQTFAGGRTQRHSSVAEIIRDVLGLEPLGELGRGATTVVYRVRRGQRQFAVKMGHAAASDTEVTAFCREAALLASLSGPGLIGIHDVGRAEGFPYLVMDLVEGQSVAEVLRNGVLDEATTARWAMQVAGALTVAHRAGLVHRDVKPHNIMVGPDGRVKVIDFGLAARAGGRAEDEAVGTFLYSAPEQTGMLRRPVDGRADLYALGAVLFECLTGTPPFRADDAGELIRQHLSVAAPDVRRARPDVSTAMASIIGRLLAKDPDDRYQSGADLLADLRDLDGSRSDPGVVETPDARVDVVPMAGREDELERLAALWRQVLAGRGGLAVVRGPAGSGKSRLAQEVASTARAAGHLVLSGKSAVDDTVPMAPLREAIDRHVKAAGRLPDAERVAAEERLRSAATDVAPLLRPLSTTLAALLDAPRIPDADNQSRCASAVAAFLAKLAVCEGGALLHLDDAQWWDEATGRVLQQLVPRLSDTPLLVIVTARDDEPAGRDGDDHQGEPAGDRLAAIPQAVPDLQITLAPMDVAAIRAMVAQQIGSARVPEQLLSRLVTCSDGNPLAVQEYVRAVVDAGLLRPSWGGWLLDDAGLDELDLPEDVVSLVLHRVTGLGDQARCLLTWAAAVGRRFHPDLVSAVAEVSYADALLALGQAVEHRLIEPVNGGRYGFVHDRVREALLAPLADVDRRRLHQRIAERLDDAGAQSPDAVYEIAHHFMSGELENSPDRRYRAAAAAGQVAFADFATADAFEYFRAAARAAAAAGIDSDAGFHAAAGLAAIRVGRYAVGDHHLQLALRKEADPVRRAQLYNLLAESHHHRWNGDRSIELVRRGLTELGHPLPGNPIAFAVTTLLSFIAGVIVGRLPRRLRVARGSDRDGIAARAALLQTGAQAAAMAMRQPFMAALSMRTLVLAHRLGPGWTYASCRAGLAVFTRAAGWRGTAERLLSSSAAVVAASGDLRGIAHLEWMRGVVHDVAPAMGADTGRTMRRALQTHGAWLDAGEYATGALELGQMQLLRGYARDAEEWYRRAEAHVERGDSCLANLYATVGIQAAAMTGRPAEAAAQLAKRREFDHTVPLNLGQRVQVAIAAIHVAVENGDVGAPLDEAIAEFAQFGMTPARVWPFQRSVWVFQAFGLLARAAASGENRRAETLDAAARAVSRLRRAVNGPVLRAFHATARASLQQLRGDHRAALRRLARMETQAAGLDLPLLEYEAAVIRARALRGLGREEEAARRASQAGLLATQQGWRTRASWVRDEFPDDTLGTGSTPSQRFGQRHSTGQQGRSNTDGSGHYNRRLKALYDVSVAAAMVLDPEQLARITLDEIVRIFGAERALLFLLDHDADDLVPYLGRDDRGRDLAEFTDFGSTLVERVRSDRQAVVVTGSEQGAALGSQSTVVHGLRSIMVAPLLLKGRLLGVVYLDSRVARGIFSSDDIELLAAVTNHVALALETARAAQLELAIRSAQRERDTAEVLRRAMTYLTDSFDPATVLTRLTATITAQLPETTVFVLQSDEQGRMILAGSSHPHLPEDENQERAGTVPVGRLTVDIDRDQALADLMTADGPRLGACDSGAPLHGLLPPDSTAWLAVPLVPRTQAQGLLIACTSARPYTDADLELAAALAGQGMAALDKALLFRQVEHLATRDALTGLNNRRHFFDLVNSGLHVWRRHNQLFAVAMVDIDHFKIINDTHGHGVGDQVIREVADRLVRTVRVADILCRYGGEEFAVVFVETTADAAQVAAERLRTAVADSPVSTEAGHIPVTISVGLAGPVAQNVDIPDLLNAADQALYRAKRAGRNRVVIAGPLSVNGP